MDNAERAKASWDKLAKIRETLAGQPCLSVLDVGCSVGFFSFSLAEDGHLVLGMEMHPKPLKWYRKVKEKVAMPAAALWEMPVTPQNVHTLPTVDVVLLLSVYHAWCVVYGADVATEMLRVLSTKARTWMFFETAEHPHAKAEYLAALPKAMGETPESVLTWERNLFLGWGAKEIRDLGRLPTEYWEKESRQMLAVRFDRQ